MATITKSGNPYKRGTYDQNNGFFWSGYSSIHVSYWTAAAYAFKIDNGTTLTGASVEVTIDQTNNPGSAYSCTLWGVDSLDASGFYYEQYATQSFNAPSSGRVTHKFTFSGLSKTPAEIYFTVSPTSRNAEANLTVDPPITATLNVPNLTVGVTPSSLYTGNTIKADFANRLGEALTVQAFYNTTLLYSTTAGSDSLNINCPENWFDVAGVTGNSMGLKLRASDSLGRTSNDATFTLRRATGGTISPVAPRSTTVNGNETISFSWTYSGDGTLTKTELQWSTDNATWSDLATISGSGTTWTAAAYEFPKGTIYWRARATNSFGLVGAWSSGVSFTVSFPTLSVGVTPSSLYAGSRITANFSNRLSRTLTVQFFYNTTLLYTTTVTSDSASILCEEAWFTTAGVSGNSMSVKIRASDDLGRVSSDVSFTVLRPVGGTISPIAPRSTTLDGTASTNFAWSYSGDGTLTKTALQWSRDNAAWTDLATVSGNGTSWTAPAISFPAGTIYWRARATNSFGLVGAWSSGVSFTVKYAAQSQAVPVNSPTSGTIIAAQTQTFQIALEASAPVYEPFTVSAATFYWRAGESGDYTAVSMTPNGNSASVTIPAGTFPSGGIQWYSSATDNTGRTTQTNVFTLSTLNSEIETVPVYPINTIEDGAQMIQFGWRYLSIDGQHSAGARIRLSQNNQDWEEYTLQKTSDNDEGIDHVSFTSNSFSAGTVWWQVQGQNQAGNWGPYSEIVSFRVFGAARISAVTGDGKPFLTVRWQTEGQLAYKIEVNGRQYGPYRGDTTRRFTTPEPLPDGLHVVKVAAQNQFSLWSAWAEANVSVTNVPGPEITVAGSTANPNIGITYFNATPPPEIVKTLPERVVQNSGTFGLVCQTANRMVSYQWQEQAPGSTSWSNMAGANTAIKTIAAHSANDGYKFRCRVYNDLGEVCTNATTFTYGSPAYMSDIFDTDLYPETGHFLIYRDGVLIGTTRLNYFTDRTALGSHEYYVIQVLQGGYYTKSNTVTLTEYVNCPAIALLSGGDFLMLELSEDANRTQTITKGGEVAYVQYSGAKFPEAEIGEAESLTVTGDVSFTAAQEAEARRFEAMLKKAVIYKTPGGEVVVGILQGFTRRDPKFFKSYTFSVTQMEWRDFTNA